MAKAPQKKPAKKAKTGRPSKYSAIMASAICKRLADGQSLREVCQGDAMPSRSTVFLWLDEHTEFSDQYARAREAQADAIFEEILEIADDGTNDWTERKNADGSTGDTVMDHEHVSRSKLRVDARKWMASKLAPKKYGDKLQTEHSGELNIGKVEYVVIDPTDQST